MPSELPLAKHIEVGPKILMPNTIRISWPTLLLTLLDHPLNKILKTRTGVKIFEHTKVSIKICHKNGSTIKAKHMITKYLMMFQLTICTARRLANIRQTFDGVLWNADDTCARILYDKHV